MLQKSLLFF